MPAATNIPEQFEYVDTIPTFDVHSEFSGEGEKVREFTEQRLQAACDAYNTRAKNRNHYGVIGPGHTIRKGPDGLPVPQLRQPPAWGIHANHRLGNLPDGTKAIFIDRYAKRGDVPDGMGGKVNGVEAIKQLPYTSVEYWTQDADGKEIPGIIGRVALLNEDPKRECGVFMYSKSEVVPAPKTRFLYADTNRINRLNAAESGRVLIYSLEQPMAFDNIDADIPDDPTAAPDAAAPDQAMIDKVIDALMVRFPGLATLGGAPAAPPPPAPAPAGPDMGAPAPAMFSRADNLSPGQKTHRDKEFAAAMARLATIENDRKEELLMYSRDDADTRIYRLEASGRGIKADKVKARFEKMVDANGRVDKAARQEYEDELMETASVVQTFSRELPPHMFLETAGPRRDAKAQGMNEADLQKKLAALRQSGETDFNKVKVS